MIFSLVPAEQDMKHSFTPLTLATCCLLDMTGNLNQRNNEHTCCIELRRRPIVGVPSKPGCIPNIASALVRKDERGHAEPHGAEHPQPSSGLLVRNNGQLAQGAQQECHFGISSQLASCTETRSMGMYNLELG